MMTCAAHNVYSFIAGQASLTQYTANACAYIFLFFILSYYYLSISLYICLLLSYTHADDAKMKTTTAQNRKENKRFPPRPQQQQKKSMFIFPPLI